MQSSPTPPKRWPAGSPPVQAVVQRQAEGDKPMEHTWISPTRPWVTESAEHHDQLAAIIQARRGRAIKVSFAVLLALTLRPIVAHGGSPPAALLGKSVIVAWREIGQFGHGTFTNNRSLSIYISNAGRVFSRMSNRGHGGYFWSSDQVAGEAHSGPGQARVSSFSGQSLTVFAPTVSGGVRRIVADFDTGFGSCNSKVTFAKETGHATAIGYDSVNKRYVEILSISVGSATCSVKNGNVFEGQ